MTASFDSRLPDRRPRLRRRPGVLSALGLLLLLTGCSSFNPLARDTRSETKIEPNAPIVPPPGAPGKYSFRIAPYLFFSDFEVDKDQPIFRELAGLRDQLCKQLHL